MEGIHDGKFNDLGADLKRILRGVYVIFRKKYVFEKCSKLIQYDHLEVMHNKGIENNYRFFDDRPRNEGRIMVTILNKDLKCFIDLFFNIDLID